MSLLASIILLLALIAVAITAASVRRHASAFAGLWRDTPEGWEDERGFHYGRPAGDVGDV